MLFQNFKRSDLALIFLLSIVTWSANAATIKDVNQLNLKAYQGRVVYLDFWASWCKPCQKSFPWMNQLQSRYKKSGLEVVTINLDSNPAAMHDFLARIPAYFEIYHDPSGMLAEKFQLKGMPTSYLIDRSGKVVRQHTGFQTDSIPAYEREIEALL